MGVSLAQLLSTTQLLSTMPGAFRKVNFVPRYAYKTDRGQVVYGTWALMLMFGEPTGDAGSYALESTREQNHFDDVVYSTDMPYLGIAPGSVWRREAMAVRGHPMFATIIGTITRPSGLTPIAYARGRTDPEATLGSLCGRTRKTMYVMSDYTGAIDVWMTDASMVPGSYACYRLVGIQRQEDWCLCRNLQFLGYRQGDPELAGRARL